MAVKQALYCEACGQVFERYPSQIRKHNFCCKQCAKSFTSKRMTNYNKTENPMNTSKGWSSEKKESVRKREQINKGPCGPQTYPKLHGKHEHRVVAEKKLGRPLKPGEVVHHIDRNKQNNDPDNIMVFENQAQHAQWHEEHDGYWHKRGGDALCQ